MSPFYQLVEINCKLNDEILKLEQIESIEISEFLRECRKEINDVNKLLLSHPESSMILFPCLYRLLDNLKAV